MSVEGGIDRYVNQDVLFSLDGLSLGLALLRGPLKMQYNTCCGLI